jgi:hypothetical protein
MIDKNNIYIILAIIVSVIIITIILYNINYKNNNGMSVIYNINSDIDPLAKFRLQIKLENGGGIEINRLNEMIIFSPDGLAKIINFNETIPNLNENELGFYYNPDIAEYMYIFNKNIKSVKQYSTPKIYLDKIIYVAYIFAQPLFI